LSKLGICSRTEAAKWVLGGRVSINGKLARDPETPTVDTDRLLVDGQPVAAAEPRYLALNKPRGLVTSASDEKGRPTIYQCIPGLTWLAPVGRLDMASEGLLLLTNDSEWAAWVNAPESKVTKTYHVKIDRLADDDLLESLRVGVVDAGECLQVVSATLLRHETRTSWLGLVLDEGRNRQIRRMLAAFGIAVVRLVRVSIGALDLGSLGKGQVRELSRDELAKAGLARPNWLSPPAS
jgi:23S rRNA pseudouridine2605 synthase